MKLKEYPKSFFKALRLRFKNVDKLKISKGSELPIIVSFTSIPSRLSKVHLVVKSILVQKSRPRLIVLWLPESLKGKLPNSLKALQGDLFQIHYSHLTCSHKKLIHSLKMFPNDIIVTCDDDSMYREGWLKSLYITHLRHPNTVIANMVRCIKRDSNGELLPYKQWKYSHVCNKEHVLPIGAEGVLYPPKTFNDIVFDECLFLELAPKADDLWFKAIALSSGVTAMKAENSPEFSIPLSGTQKISLKKENIGEDKNKIQWQNLSNYFKLSI